MRDEEEGVRWRVWTKVEGARRRRWWGWGPTSLHLRVCEACSCVRACARAGGRGGGGGGGEARRAREAGSRCTDIVVFGRCAGLPYHLTQLEDTMVMQGRRALCCAALVSLAFASALAKPQNFDFNSLADGGNPFVVQAQPVADGGRSPAAPVPVFNGAAVPGGASK